MKNDNVQIAKRIFIRRAPGSRLRVTTLGGEVMLEASQRLLPFFEILAEYEPTQTVHLKELERHRKLFKLQKEDWNSFLDFAKEWGLLV